VTGVQTCALPICQTHSKEVNVPMSGVGVSRNTIIGTSQKDGWVPFRDEYSDVSSFLLGHSKVPGSFDIKETETGRMWRFSKAD